MNTEADFACCRHSSCLCWSLRDSSLMCFQCKRWRTKSKALDLPPNCCFKITLKNCELILQRPHTPTQVFSDTLAATAQHTFSLTAEKAQVYLILLTMALFYLSVPVSQHTQLLGPETSKTKLRVALIKIIPALISQNVCCNIPGLSLAWGLLHLSVPHILSSLL